MSSLEEKTSAEPTLFFQLLAERLGNCRFAGAGRSIEPEDTTVGIILGGPVPQVLKQFGPCLCMAFGLRRSFCCIVKSITRRDTPQNLYTFMTTVNTQSMSTILKRFTCFTATLDMVDITPD
jgi:hypothetical protein